MDSWGSTGLISGRGAPRYLRFARALAGGLAGVEGCAASDRPGSSDDAWTDARSDDAARDLDAALILPDLPA